MTDKVLHLSKYQEPVRYNVQITHHYDDNLEVFVEGVSDDQRSRDSVADSLERAAFVFRQTHPADAMHSIMLAMIDSAMGATRENPAVFRISPDELRTWADAVAEWEERRHSLSTSKKD